MLFLTKKSEQSIRGNSLVTILLSVSLVSGMALMVTKVMDVSLKGQKRSSLKSSWEEIRAGIRESIHCDDTMVTNGITPANVAAACTSTSAAGGQVGPFLRLRKKTNAAPMNMNTSWNATDGTATFGEYEVRVSCSNTEKTLVVRVARPNGSGGFHADPMTGQAADWNSDSGLLFGNGASATPLCGSRLGMPPLPPSGGAISCADPDAYLIGINFATRTAICRPVRNTPLDILLVSGQKFAWFNQARGGAIDTGVSAALPIYRCTKVQGGHNDIQPYQNGCPSGWAGTILGYAYH